LNNYYESIKRLTNHQEIIKKRLSTYIITPPKSSKVKNLFKYYQYLNDDLLTDITFRIEDTQIKAHKIILAEASDYFHHLFISPFRESNQDIIDIYETTPKVFKTLINIIYGEDILNLNWGLLLEVIILIERYQITKFNSKDLLKKVEIPPEGFIKLIEIINSLYHDVIDIIASKIKYEVDLSSLSNEFIVEILTSTRYHPINLEVTTNMLNHLKNKGIVIDI